MAMTVMTIRVVQMAVAQRRVLVEMRVRFLAVPREIVCMSMVFVVHVTVCMGERLVFVRMRVTLGEMQPGSP